VLRLGNLELDLPAIQAPISGYSDWAMRQLAREFGAPLTFSGLMLAKSAVHARLWRQGGFRLGEQERPLGGQLLGRDPEEMARAAEVLAAKGYDLIDLNFACPAPKVLARGRGGALLREPELAVAIFRRVRARVSLPLTIKLRTAFAEAGDGGEGFWRIAAAAAAEGVDGLIVHGRAVAQRYRGHADWGPIAEVKRRFPRTVVLGSGDLLSAEAAVQRLGESGVDGVVIARGAIGNPWIFRELRALLAGEPAPPPPTLTEVGQVMDRHFTQVLELYERRRAIGYFRKFCVGYCRRHPRRRKALLALMAAETAEHVRLTIADWFLRADGAPVERLESARESTAEEYAP